MSLKFFPAPEHGPKYPLVETSNGESGHWNRGAVTFIGRLNHESYEYDAYVDTLNPGRGSPVKVYISSRTPLHNGWSIDTYLGRSGIGIPLNFLVDYVREHWWQILQL